MKPKALVICCIAFVALSHFSTSWALPGGRPVIEASRFASIQEALDAVPASGGLVRLPPGEFEIREPLRIEKEDVMLVGSGGATHIRNLNEAGASAIVIGDPRGHDVPNDERLWRVSIRDLRVTGNPKSGHGIEAIRIQEIHLSGVTVSEHGKHGILLDQCYEDPRVTDCLITYNQQTGLQLLGCHDIVVSANQFEENFDALACLNGFNLCMSGNNLDDHLNRGVVIENTYGSIVSANMIEECQGAAVFMDRDCYGNTVSANVIAHNGEGVVLDDSHGCAVSANTFTINAERAVFVGSASSRITISANNFSNSHIGDNQVKRAANDLAAAGIEIRGANVNVSGNVFSGLRPKAIDISEAAAKSTLVTGNLIVDAPVDSAFRDADGDGNLRVESSD